MSDCMIPLTRGYVARVSPEHYEALACFKWTYTPRSNRNGGYAYRLPTIGRRRVKVFMHRFIMAELMGLPIEGWLIDHRDGDGLNNTIGNLRVATAPENGANKNGLGEKSASGFIGVSITPNGRYQAYIGNNGTREYLGVFEHADAAAIARDRRAVEIFGSFAQLNFPDGEPF